MPWCGDGQSTADSPRPLSLPVASVPQIAPGQCKNRVLTNSDAVTAHAALGMKIISTP